MAASYVEGMSTVDHTADPTLGSSFAAEALPWTMRVSFVPFVVNDSVEIEAEVEEILARIDRELAVEEALTKTLMTRHGL